MRPATDDELHRWDTLIQGNPDGGQILQTRAWSDVKARWGWQPVHMVADDGGDGRGPLAVLFLRRRIAGLGDLWYAPKGPGVRSLDALAALLNDRRHLQSAFLLKVEPELLRDDIDNEDIARAGLHRATADVQIYGATIVVDLRPDEAALLGSFKPKTRYNIRLASRRGVTVHHVVVNDATLDVMHRLMVATGTRAGFPLRQRAYFIDYWRTQAAVGQGELFLARLGDEVLSGAYVTRLGRKAWYKDGGSTRRHSELMAPHLLQWEIMRWLRRQGVESYDLVAVPRRSELHSANPMWGLYRFKSGFCDHINEYVGTLDLPLSAAKYALWNGFGERAAALWSTQFRRDLLY